LVASLEHALAQQARVTAAWLGQTAVVGRESSGSLNSLRSPNAAESKALFFLDPGKARAVLDAIGDRRTARFRIVDTEGRLLADSSDRIDMQSPATAASSRGSRPNGDEAEDFSASAGVIESKDSEPFLYRLFSTPYRAWKRLFAPPTPTLSSADYYAASGSVLLGSEVKDALAGRYGAATRVSSGGQVSVTLYSAVPVYAADDSVVGAVLLSQSTYRILRDLYAIRLDIAWIFVGNLAAAAALSVLLAFTIVNPLRKLGAAAAAVLAPLGAGRVASAGDAVAAFPETSRGDEIGDLQRSLRGLVIRLGDRMRQIERFAADAAHEFRNPLAAIRSAAELAEGTGDAASRARFLHAILDDTERLRAVIDGLRRLSLAEAGAQSQEVVSIEALAAARAACEAAKQRAVMIESAAPVSFSAFGEAGAKVNVDPAALDVMLGNLFDNAASFAKSRVTVSVLVEGDFVVFAVEDDGPGIPPEHLGRVFDRFFTWRPGERRSAHTGLGLSLVKALAESSGGSVSAANRTEEGACFILRLPAATQR
jgi:two-component system sensor histidine kinase ChvG